MGRLRNGVIKLGPVGSEMAASLSSESTEGRGEEHLGHYNELW